MLGEEGSREEAGGRSCSSVLGWLRDRHPGLKRTTYLGPGSPPSPPCCVFWPVCPSGKATDPAGTCCLPLGEGCLSVARHPGSTRGLGTAMLLTPFILLLLPLLAMPAPSHAWSRPLWYQVGLDLQPWGCHPNTLEGCGGSLGCPGHWMGLGMNRIYPVAGVTLTTTMMLMVSRAVLQRWRSQGTKSEHPQVTTSPSGPWKRRNPISDRALLIGVLHMLDALLVHIDCHLRHITTKQKTPIKGSPTQSG
ncbi:transmembrane protein 89 [Neofelis nebulosa]|uniref:transmembrane protein 89 n=1 Tax=Neofelis nebulosa TaxID=61452 RepID=UPI00272B0819|nr:transmembrane protein 89 [Neofelis nebulosa]